MIRPYGRVSAFTLVFTFLTRCATVTLPTDAFDALEHDEVDISPAGTVSRRKSLLRTEKLAAGLLDGGDLGVDALGEAEAAEPFSLPALEEQEQEPVPFTQQQPLASQEVSGIPNQSEPQAASDGQMVAALGFDPMQDTIDSIISDLMPYKEELLKMNSTMESQRLNKTSPEQLKEEEKLRKRREQLQRESQCWKDCKGCHFKEAQAIDECLPSLDDAKIECAERVDCKGIATQREVCNGTWTMQLGDSAETVEVVDGFETWKMEALVLNQQCLLDIRTANMSKYVISLENKSWVEAERACADEGLQLASPRSKEDIKALNAAMKLHGAEKVQIGLRRDVQYGEGYWTDPKAFYWVDGEKLDADWPGWGGYGFTADSLEVPEKQPHWVPFLEGCCYIGYFQTIDEDGTKGAADTTCEHFQIPYACEPIQERQVRETVTTTTSTAAPLHFGLALTGSGQCPDFLGVSAVPLSRCQEAAAKAILPPGAKRGRTALQAGYNVGSKDPAQPWLGAPTGCSLHSAGDWAPVFNMGRGVNNGEYTPLCEQPMPTESSIVEGIEVVETAFPYDRSGKYFNFPAQEWEEKTGRDLSPHGTTQSISQFRNLFPVWSGIVRVWKNMLGVHGRREFGAKPDQWHRGDIIKVGIMCPSGFSLIPHDLDGPDAMHFETTSLEGCAEKCQEQVKCSSFEFSHSETACNTFSLGLENLRTYSFRPNEWISCVRADLVGSEAFETMKASTTTVTTDPFAWKTSKGTCVSPGKGEINTGMANVGNMSSKDCHEACRNQIRCTAFQLALTGPGIGVCSLHTAAAVTGGTGTEGAICSIKPLLVSCGQHNSEDCAEGYAVADYHKSMLGFCQKCIASDGDSLLRDRCQLCCEKCPFSQDAGILPGPLVGGEGKASLVCEPNTFDLDDNVSNGCEAGCPAVFGAKCVECPTPTNCTQMSCKDNYYDEDGNISNGCEVLCPSVHNAVCKRCQDSICTLFDCKPGFFDGDFNVRNGCEAPCPEVPFADCVLCQGPWVCKDYKCHANRFEVDQNYSNGCEATCPSRPHASCPECHNPFKCAKALSCDKDWYDADAVEENGCEVQCPSVKRGTCLACSGKPLECFDILCDGSWFDVDGKIETGCEVTCAPVPHGNCTSCSTPEKCTTVSCDVNRFDTDGNVENGCEATCPSVAKAKCTNCSSATTCTMLSACEDNFFNDDGDARNGCEATCPSVADGTCDACATSSQCTALTCNANFFDVDGDAMNGCEVGCPQLAQADFVSCDSPSLCQALRCHRDWASRDGDVMNGCEMQCGQVPHASCVDCQTVGTCSQVECDANYYDDDGDPENGCEVSCPNVTHGICLSCSSSSQCTNITCLPNWFDADGDRQSCEAPCGAVAGGDCLTCNSPTDCTSVNCHDNFYDQDGAASNGCEVLCPKIGQAVCNSCGLMEGNTRVCTALSCEKNWFDVDMDARNGCEVTCPVVSHGRCTTCARPFVCDSVECDDNWFNDDWNISNGCEETCPQVLKGKCVSCTSSQQCTKLECDRNYFDVDGLADTGCEVTCPRVIWGMCLSCTSPSACDELTSCPPNTFNFDGNNSNGCEGVCKNVTGGVCTSCTTTDNCKVVECFNNTFDVDNDAETGCEGTCSSPSNAECISCQKADTCDRLQCHSGYYDADGDMPNGCEVNVGPGGPKPPWVSST